MRSLRPLRPRPAVMAVLLILIVACGAAARSGETRVVRSFAAPGDWPFGLDYVETSTGVGTLYHTDNYTGDVYSITTSGAATVLFNVPDALGQPYTYYRAQGICFLGSPDNQPSGTLYILEADRGGSPPYYTYVRSFTMDGTHLDTYDVSSSVDRAYGIAFDGNHFWLIGYGELIECDTDFNLVQSHVVPWGVSNGGLDFDPSTNLLYSSSLSFDSIIAFERGASSLTYQQYLGIHNIISVAIGHVTRESRTLWIMNNSEAPGMIEEINDDYYDPVESQSWGGIKALYR